MAKNISWICANEECGSSRVQVKMWVDANTSRVDGIPFLIQDVENEDTWCEDCETHSGIVSTNKD